MKHTLKVKVGGEVGAAKDQENRQLTLIASGGPARSLMFSCFLL